SIRLFVSKKGAPCIELCMDWLMTAAIYGTLPGLLCHRGIIMRFVHTLVMYLSLPLTLLRLLWRARLAPAYARRWGERFGFFAPLATRKKVVWIHTVSLGEFIAALPLVRALLQRPELQLVVTTTTPTGSERVIRTLGDSV